MLERVVRRMWSYHAEHGDYFSANIEINGDYFQVFLAKSPIINAAGYIFAVDSCKIVRMMGIDLTGDKTIIPNHDWLSFAATLMINGFPRYVSTGLEYVAEIPMHASSIFPYPTIDLYAYDSVLGISTGTPRCVDTDKPFHILKDTYELELAGLGWKAGRSTNDGDVKYVSIRRHDAKPNRE